MKYTLPPLRRKRIFFVFRYAAVAACFFLINGVGFIIDNFKATVGFQGLRKSLVKNGLEIKCPRLIRYIETLIQNKILYRYDRFDLKAKKLFDREKYIILRIHPISHWKIWSINGRRT